MNTELIRRIERAAERAVPSEESRELGAWRMHRSHGYIRRLNSTALHTEHPDAAGVHARLAKITAFYADWARPPMIRQTSADAWLDPEVSTWSQTGETLVMVAEPTFDVVPTVASDDEWIAWVSRRAQITDRLSEAVASLRRVSSPHVNVLGGVDGREVAAGRAVFVENAVGLFDISTDETHRRLGLGRAITRSLMSWSGSVGADLVYLQVSAVNEPALGLYRGLGFTEAYRYRYRTRR